MGRVAAVRRAATSAPAFLGLSNISSQCLSFIGGLLIARVLGAPGRGTTAVVAAYDDLSNNALSLGAPVAVGYHAARTDEDRERREAMLLGAALRIAFFVTPLGCLLGWVIMEFALSGYSDRIGLLVFLAISGTPLVNTVPTAGRMILTARGQLRRLGSLILVIALVRLLAFTVLWQIGELTAFTAAFSYLGVGWLGSIATWFVVGVRPRRGGSATELLTYGIKVVPAMISDMANSRLDQVVMAPLLGASDLGIYAVAVGVAFVPTNVASSLSLSIYRSAAQDSGARLRTRRKVVRAAMIIGFVGVCTAVGAAILVVPFYGSEFGDSVLPAVILGLASSLFGISAVLVGVGNATGSPDIGAKSSMSALVITLVGLPLLLPPFGVLGAALVTALSYSTRLAVSYRLTTTRGLLGTPVSPTD